MARENREKQINRLYRDHLHREVRNPLVREEKRKLIQSFFAESAPVWAWQKTLAFAVGIVAVFSFLVFFAYQHPAWVPQSISTRQLAQPAPVQPEPILEIHPLVTEVKRLTSRVGPTMVYQKMYRETPITIVWVFASGEVL